MRKVQQVAEIFQRVAKSEAVKKLEESSQVATMAGVVDLLTALPDEMAKVLELATTTTESLGDAVLDATPRELAEAFAKIWEMNNFVDIVRKKVQMFPTPAPAGTAHKR
jgi:hypothetical protein